MVEVDFHEVTNKYYEKLEDFKQICPKCGNSLVHVYNTDDGDWECENFESKECDYLEYNNITECHGEGCSNLVLSAKTKWYSERDQCEKEAYFWDLSDQYCSIKQGFDQISCLDIAQHESDEMMREDEEITQEMKRHPKGCDCILHRCY